MIFTTITIYVAATLLAITSSVTVSAAGVGGGLGFGRKRPGSGPGAAPPAPVDDPACLPVRHRMNPSTMIRLKNTWYNLYGNDNPQGYVAAFGGTSMNIEAGTAVGSNMNIFLLEYEDPRWHNTEQYAYYVGKNQACRVKGLPTHTSDWKMNIYATTA